MIPPWPVRVARVKHDARVEEFPPTTDAYERVSAYWDQYAGWFVPGYGRFLLSAAAHYGFTLTSALDLACGTGLISRQLAQHAESVVGLDSSEAMLRRAAELTSDENVRYVRGDVRAFDLGETFDAAVCGSDSLNYLSTPAELTEVFRCVRRHLRPGGVFAFDALDDAYFRAIAPLKAQIDVGGVSFDVYHFYDPDRRVGDARAVFRDCVEAHRRIPIEEEEVRRAAAAAGLTVAEHFSCNSLSLFKQQLARQFYVVRAP